MGQDVEAGKGMQQALASLETAYLADRLGRGCRKTRGFVMGQVSSFGAPVAPLVKAPWVSLWRQSWFSEWRCWEGGDGIQPRPFACLRRGAKFVPDSHFLGGDGGGHRIPLK